jgi:hypothetical protein
MILSAAKFVLLPTQPSGELLVHELKLLLNTVCALTDADNNSVNVKK